MRIKLYTVIGSQSIGEMSTLSFTAIATDADTSSQTLTFSLFGAPTGATLTAGGNFSFAPSAAQSPNSYTFDVVTDNDLIFENGFEIN